MRMAFIYSFMLGCTLFGPPKLWIPVDMIGFAIRRRVQRIDGKWDWWK